jgi:hypothetical protein
MIGRSRAAERICFYRALYSPLSFQSGPKIWRNSTHFRSQNNEKLSKMVNLALLSPHSVLGPGKLQALLPTLTQALGLLLMHIVEANILYYLATLVEIKPETSG